MRPTVTRLDVARDCVLITKQRLIDAVRAWARAECGDTEAERLLAALAEYDDALELTSREAHRT
jgi:hypothetical protein